MKVQIKKRVVFSLPEEREAAVRFEMNNYLAGWVEICDSDSRIFEKNENYNMIVDPAIVRKEL